MKKLLILLCLLARPVVATPVVTTTAARTINGSSVTLIEAPSASAPYYRLSYMTVVRGGGNVHVRKALIYSAGVTEDIDNLYCATTYAEIQAECTTLGIPCPLDPASGSSLSPH